MFNVSIYLSALTVPTPAGTEIPAPPSFVWLDAGMMDPTAPIAVPAKRERLEIMAAIRLDEQYNALRDTVESAKLYRNKFHVGYPYVAALIPSITAAQWSLVRGMVDFLWSQQTSDEKFCGDSVHLNDAGLRASGDHSLARDLVTASSWSEEQQVRALGWVWTYRAQLETRRLKRGAIKGNRGAVLLGWVIPR